MGISPIIIGAGIAAIVTAIGWFITDSFHHRRLRKESTLRHLDRQIEELYGPLLGLIQLSRHVYEVAATVLPSLPDADGKGRTDTSRFSNQHWEAWRFLCETYFHPINAQVRELVSAKTHLMSPDTPHDIFEEFFRHCAHSECRYRLWKEKGVDTSSIPGPRYPRGFEQKVAGTLMALRKQRDDCLRSLGVRDHAQNSEAEHLLSPRGQ